MQMKFHLLSISYKLLRLSFGANTKLTQKHFKSALLRAATNLEEVVQGINRSAYASRSTLGMTAHFICELIHVIYLKFLQI